MAQNEILPERLQYLQPFRQFLSKLPKSEVGDGTDTALLEEALRVRLKGYSTKKAKSELSCDLKELENYLSVPHRRNDRLHFAVGFLLIAAEKPEELLKPPEKPKERLVMSLPPNAKSKYFENWSLTVDWKRQHFCASPLDMTYDFGRELFLAKLAHPNANDYELYKTMGWDSFAERILPAMREVRPPAAISVNLDKVVGYKWITEHEKPFVWKTVDYKLKIPGGYASVGIQAKSLFDESEWDSYLATLRFEKSAP